MRGAKFYAAARLCRVSQPSSTNAIKALETTLGGQLFVRHLADPGLTADLTHRCPLLRHPRPERKRSLS
ncbi:MAG: LysR family transcriptional regulator [Gemmatimonas sp.]